MDSTTPQHQAVLWQALDGRQVQCDLCAHRCRLNTGCTGRCGVRTNVDGMLITTSYGRLCSAAADPIEKKPFFHFLPGTRSFSVATHGCNLTCQFCQNWQISQLSATQTPVDYISPEKVVQAALDNGCASIAYTYTEPTIFMEWATDCAQQARSQQLANVFVSNGYMTPEAVAWMAPWLDGINVDLKAFSEGFYQSLCGARLAPVLETLETIARYTDIWVEVTTLLVPDQNDGVEELKALANWLVEHVGPQVPWHVSRFHAQYRYTASLVTPLESLQRAYDIGKAAGLHHVYMGNVPGSSTESTHCFHCGECLIERHGFALKDNRLQQGNCPACAQPLAGFGLQTDVGKGTD